MTKKKAESYKAVVGLQSDKKGTRFEPGDIVTDGDFPASVIKYWLEVGNLKKIRGGKK